MILPKIGKVVIVKCRIKYGRIVHTLAAKRMYEALFDTQDRYIGEKEKWVAITDGNYGENIKEVADVFSWQPLVS